MNLINIIIPFKSIISLILVFQSFVMVIINRNRPLSSCDNTVVISSDELIQSVHFDTESIVLVAFASLFSIPLISYITIIHLLMSIKNKLNLHYNTFEPHTGFLAVPIMLLGYLYLLGLIPYIFIIFINNRILDVDVNGVNCNLMGSWSNDSNNYIPVMSYIIGLILLVEPLISYEERYPCLNLNKLFARIIKVSSLQTLHFICPLNVFSLCSEEFIREMKLDKDEYIFETKPGALIEGDQVVRNNN